MGTDSLLVALGDEDSDRIDRIAATVRKVATPGSTRVVVGHVLGESAFESAAKRLSDPAAAGSEGGSISTPKPNAATGTHTARATTGGDTEPFEADTGPDQVVAQKVLVKDIVEALEAEGIEPTVRGAVGNPAEEIVRIASALDPDFVVVGGRDQSATRKALFGSVSERIIRSVDCPVITIRGTA